MKLVIGWRILCFSCGRDDDLMACFKEGDEQESENEVHACQKCINEINEEVKDDN